MYEYVVPADAYWFSTQLKFSQIPTSEQQTANRSFSNDANQQEVLRKKLEESVFNPSK